jgi:hypothetical protein
MSLAITAAPWTNENQTNSTRRRIPYSRRTTLKQNRAYPQYNDYSVSPANDEIASDIYSPIDANYLNPATPEAVERGRSEKGGRESEANEKTPLNMNSPNVKEILNKLQKFDGIENSGNGLADFTPLPPPQINQLRDRTKSAPIALSGGPSDMGAPYLESMVGERGAPTAAANDNENVPIYKPAPPISKIAAANDLGLYTNYRTGYMPPKNLDVYNFGTRTNPKQSQGVVQDLVLEKLNYIVHMLEDQQHERTSNITEEVLLYTFLGVFIIFICDTFARAGKYYR